jgi:MFS family permease
MQVKVDPSVIGQIRWHDYAIRFLFGGLITVAAGIIAKRFGPGIGGLFLAFPAIFPASATLIEKHEKEKKEEKRLHGTRRGRAAASVDAAGSAMGSLGLLVFASIVWQFGPRYSAWIVLLCATVAWLTVSVLIWYVRKQI